MRCQVIAAPRLYTPPFTRSYSASRNDDDGGDAGSGGGKLMDSIRADVEGGGMTLEERLQDMGLDPVEYKQLWKSQQAAEKRFEEWEPKTRSEAEQRWKEMQSKPDHLTLLQMYKKAGIEPIKLAKCVAPAVTRTHTHTGTLLTGTGNAASHSPATKPRSTPRHRLPLTSCATPSTSRPSTSARSAAPPSTACPCATSSSAPTRSATSSSSPISPSALRSTWDSAHADPFPSPV